MNESNKDVLARLVKENPTIKLPCGCVYSDKEQVTIIACSRFCYNSPYSNDRLEEKTK